jgi:hypothetical protein
MKTFLKLLKYYSENQEPLDPCRRAAVGSLLPDAAVGMRDLDGEESSRLEDVIVENVLDLDQVLDSKMRHLHTNEVRPQISGSLPTCRRQVSLEVKIQIQIIEQTLQPSHLSTHFSKQTRLKHVTFFRHINNIFFSKEQKEQIMTIFQKTQKAYLSLVKFANQVRHKIAKERITTDLRMEPIDPNSRYAYPFVQMGSKYWFTLSDLINIIQIRITNSENMFSSPTFPKNPYNNIRFTTTEMYNIYYAIKSTYATVPKWIQLFFESGFDLKQFTFDNEMHLREHYIKHYVCNGETNDLYEEIINMLKEYNSLFGKLRISRDFPKKDFVDIFRPYLLLYMYSVSYVSGTAKKYNADEVIYRKLKQFAKFNENFGRKNIVLNNVFVRENSGIINRKAIHSYTFNKNHPEFTLSDAYNLLYKKDKKNNNDFMSLRSFREALTYYESMHTTSSQPDTSNHRFFEPVAGRTNVRGADDFIDLSNEYSFDFDSDESYDSSAS